MSTVSNNTQGVKQGEGSRSRSISFYECLALKSTLIGLVCVLGAPVLIPLWIGYGAYKIALMIKEKYFPPTPLSATKATKEWTQKLNSLSISGIEGGPVAVFDKQFIKNTLAALVKDAQIEEWNLANVDSSGNWAE